MKASRASTEARQLRTLARLAFLGALLAPSSLVHGGPTLCAVRRLTGLPCPTCGLTRSWQAATRLDIRRSIAFHPLGMPTIALAGVVGFGDGRMARRLAAPLPATALGIGWIAVWLIRLRRAAVARNG